MKSYPFVSSMLWS